MQWEWEDIRDLIISFWVLLGVFLVTAGPVCLAVWAVYNGLV